MRCLRNIMRPDGFTLIELMVVIAILAVLSAIAIPNFISYRNKAYCSDAESNANIVAGGIADYYSMPLRTSLPTIDDLDVIVENPVVIQGNPNTTISIKVTDMSGRCPTEYQDANDHWSNFVFTKYVR